MNAIVIGASSGIGRAVAVELSRAGHTLGLAARRMELLEALQFELPGPSFVQRMDITQTEEAVGLLQALIERMGGADLIVVNAGIGFRNPELRWELDRDIIATNVIGAAAMASAAVQYFMGRGAGHLVTISSVAGLRGHGRSPAYNASKAFLSCYADGLRHKLRQLGLPVHVTDVRPGFVDTDMIRGRKWFWVAPAEKAARQICSAIRRRRRRVYVTRRWTLVAWLTRLAPDTLWYRVP